MMREILFRGKRLDNSEWVEGNLHTLFDGTTLIISKGAGGFTISHGEDVFQTAHVYEIDPETVGQFTGLTDKNGRKIFEGDVLSWVDWKGIKRSSCVQYDAEWNRFCVRLSGAESIGVNRHLSSDIEVIGNRWDNPELLEGV